MFFRSLPDKKLAVRPSRRVVKLPVALSGVALFVCLAAGAAPDSPPQSPPKFDYAKDIEPVLIDYCYDCHGDGMDKGEIALDDYPKLEDLFGDRKLWESVYHNMDGLLMPPSDKKQPSDEERRKVIQWIESAVFKLDPANPDPGRVTIRRLNREEYNNTVRDLVGVDIRPADDFPEDDSGYGFDNIGDVLTVSPALMERYLSASARIMNTAIITEPPKPGEWKFGKEKISGLDGRPGGSGSLSSNGRVGFRIPVPQDGDYELSIIAGGSPAKNEWPLMDVKFAGAKTTQFRVDNERKKLKGYAQTVPLKKGDLWVEVAFTNDAYDPKAQDPRQRDRNLEVGGLILKGPFFKSVPPPGEAHKKLFAVADPKAPEPERARKIIAEFARRAFRRPVDPEEVDRLFALYESTRKDGENFDSGVKLALRAVLVSPRFLFRGEIRPDPNNPAKIQPVDEYALASRLSYFLWSTMPDEELFKLAEQKQLRANLDAQITRMLKDRKASELTENFAGQWLQLRNLEIATPHSGTYKGWNSSLKVDMREETERFFDHILRENRSVLEFLNADYTFLNERLAKHYEIPEVKGNDFRLVKLTGPAARQRGGVMTHASILTITSNPTRTSAVNRGKWVLENLLGTPPPPPPEAVPALEIDRPKRRGEKPVEKTLRQQLEEHRADSMCASCHKRMDPIGFAMENYDGIGRWRDKEYGKPIDASGELYTGEKFEGAPDLRAILYDQKKEAFVKCLSEAMLTYALGRGLEYYDKPAVHDIAEAAAKADFRFHALVKGIVDSVPFQKARGDQAGATVSANP